MKKTRLEAPVIVVGIMILVYVHLGAPFSQTAMCPAAVLQAICMGSDMEILHDGKDALRNVRK